jgi:hypothetical protein
MGQSASQAHKFYEEVANTKVVWIAILDGEYLKFDIAENKVSMPVWSSKSRIQRIKKLNVDTYSSLEAKELPWEEFLSTVGEGLKQSGHLIGINLSGKNLTGYDRDIDGVCKSVAAYASHT